MKKSFFLFMLLFLSACGSAAPSNSAATKIAPTATPQVVFYGTVGKPIIMIPWKISLESVKIIDPATIPQHDQIFPSVTANQHFLLLNEHIENISNSSANVGGMQFALQNTNGDSFSEQLGLPGIDSSGLGGTMAPSIQQAGQQVYIVPTSEHSFLWIYTADDNLHQIIWKFSA